MKRAPHVLFISGSVGLGHVTRDLAIASALRARCPDLRLLWLAGDPARQGLLEAGEGLAPESGHFGGETEFAEALAEGFKLPLTNPLALLKSPRALRGACGLRRHQKRNLRLFRELIGREHFDLVVGDEIFDLMVTFAFRPALRPAPLATIVDFVGLDTPSRNPLEWVWVQVLMRSTAWVLRRLPRVSDLTLMVGEEEDVADRPMGLFLPNRREWARAVLKFVGYVCPFDPAGYQDRARLRQRLGYGPEPLVICAIGGTAIGRGLLELCGRAYPLLKERFSALRMILVCGPRLKPETVDVPDGVDRKGFVLRLYEHFAACDLAIVQGGGTTTLELTALRRPFLYFPIEAHFEQRSHVAGRIERHGAGVRLEFKHTTPETLAAAALAYLGAEPHYPPIATDGARRAAELLIGIMENPPDRGVSGAGLR